MATTQHIILKQNTSATVQIGPFLDDADFKTLEPSLTITEADILLAKNGGALAAITTSQTASYGAHGFYSIELVPTDVNTLGHLLISAYEDGAQSVQVNGQVVPANVYDTLFGSDKFDVNVAEMATGIVSGTTLAAGAYDSIWDEAMHGTHTARQLLGILLPAFAGGKATGGGTAQITMRDVDDGFDALILDVDENGNRSSTTIAYS